MKTYVLLSVRRKSMVKIAVTDETMEKLYRIGKCPKGKPSCKNNELFTCTRQKGHTGPHIGNGAGEVVALWAQDFTFSIFKRRNLVREDQDKFFRRLGW